MNEEVLCFRARRVYTSVLSKDLYTIDTVLALVMILVARAREGTGAINALHRNEGLVCELQGKLLSNMTP